ncbi:MULTISPECIES: hypothetical protein [unclassified Neptuniibacter]|uniref:hypothetical protein n=1 Tax=unclassified Neptuniibacter TaxID=2630693 RepID=UPI0025E17A81|nr:MULTISPECIES: hypothetical protein [unclassified Neptuniibacter]
MNTDCVHCFELIKTGKDHPLLKTVSDLGHSQICKCGQCGSLLMSTAGQWEMVLKGSISRRQKRNKRNAA